MNHFETGFGGPALRLPTTQLTWEARVLIAPRQDLGKGPLGERFIIPILGGEFKGPRIAGKVLSGGADRQLLRADGVKELDAFYEMQADNGDVITIRNKVVIHEPAGGTRYAISNVRPTAPAGAHEWLNWRTFVGTVDRLQGEPASVLIRVFEVVH
jgi:hypothetical protein